MQARLRVIGSLLVVALVFALVPAVAMAVEADTTGWGTITGTAIDSVTKYPIPFADYKTKSFPGQINDETNGLSARAGADGKIVLLTHPGTYTVEAKAPDSNWVSAGATHETTKTVRSIDESLSANYRPDGVVVTSDTATPLNLEMERNYQPVYRFFYKPAGTHLYTADDSEFAKVFVNSKYSYDGVAYILPVGSTFNTTWLYRYFNIKNGTHFYTLDPAERAKVAAMTDTYRLDGPAYQVSAKMFGPRNEGAVFRYYKGITNSHFYTMDSYEIDASQQLSALYKLDGIGFWVHQGTTAK